MAHPHAPRLAAGLLACALAVGPQLGCELGDLVADDGSAAAGDDAPIAAADAPARGIFVQDRSGSHLTSSPQTLAAFEQRVTDALDRPYVSGFAMVYSWRAFAPATAAEASSFASYRYEPIDFALAEAAARGKQISITLDLGSQGVPSYVLDECPRFAYTHPHPAVGRQLAPVPWSSCYYYYLNRVVDALARHVDGHPALRSVSIVGPSTLHGVETNWPMVPGSIGAADAATLGFSLERFESHWKRNVRYFVDHFPNTPLALGLHRAIDHDGVAASDADAVARRIRDYAVAYYAANTRRRDRRIILRLLGLTDDNPAYFAGPYDGTDAHLTAYVALAWDRRDAATLMYEGAATFSKPSPPPTGAAYLQILRNGSSWDGAALDVGYPDLEPYEPWIKQAASWYE